MVSIPERVIATAALVGLGVGILLDVLCLRRWMVKFYDVDWRLALPTCLFWVMIATAWFMGLPLGTFALGILAGWYVGRRQKHARTSTAAFVRQKRTASLLVALVTGLVSLGIGVLALGETYIMADIQRIMGTSPGATTSIVGPAIVVVLSLILVAVQHWCTRTAATLAFKWGRRA